MSYEAARGRDHRRILAMGGGGFTTDDRSAPLDELVIRLTEKPVPRICFLPTASGDPREQVMRFRETFAQWPCEPSILSLFHLARTRTDPVAHLLAQDAIYVGGGSMRNMLAIWREHRIDRAMREAWQRGVVLAGLSAGAMCWFRGGISMSGGHAEPVAGLGMIASSLSVHLDSEPERLTAYRAAVSARALPPGYAVDDGAALVFAGDKLIECVSARPDARVLSVRPVDDSSGLTVEEVLPFRVLVGTRKHGMLAGSGHGVGEFRDHRAGRRRWG